MSAAQASRREGKGFSPAQLKPFVLTPAEAWARTVSSDVLISTGPPNARKDVPALNIESRKLLCVLAACLNPGADTAVIEVGDLQQKTGFSSRRIGFCLRALRAARLLGQVKRLEATGQTYLSAELLMNSQDANAGQGGGR